MAKRRAATRGTAGASQLGVTLDFEVNQGQLQDLLQRFDAVGEFTARPADWGRRVADELRDALADATDTWKHKPEFKVELVRDGGNAASLRVSTQDKVFGYVNLGTRPHRIRAKRPGGSLAFNGSFSPKTTPGSLTSVAGFSGPPVRFAREVWHPGTEGRHFEVPAAERAEERGTEKIRQELEQRINKRFGGG